jgi:hypothetical protein
MLHNDRRPHSMELIPRMLLFNRRTKMISQRHKLASSLNILPVPVRPCLTLLPLPVDPIPQLANDRRQLIRLFRMCVDRLPHPSHLHLLDHHQDQ